MQNFDPVDNAYYQKCFDLMLVYWLWAFQFIFIEVGPYPHLYRGLYV